MASLKKTSKIYEASQSRPTSESFLPKIRGTKRRKSRASSGGTKAKGKKKGKQSSPKNRGGLENIHKKTVPYDVDQPQDSKQEEDVHAVYGQSDENSHAFDGIVPMTTERNAAEKLATSQDSAVVTNVVTSSSPSSITLSTKLSSSSSLVSLNKNPNDEHTMGTEEPASNSHGDLLQDKIQVGEQYTNDGKSSSDTTENNINSSSLGNDNDTYNAPSKTSNASDLKADAPNVYTITKLEEGNASNIYKAAVEPSSHNTSSTKTGTKQELPPIVESRPPSLAISETIERTLTTSSEPEPRQKMVTPTVPDKTPSTTPPGDTQPTVNSSTESTKTSKPSFPRRLTKQASRPQLIIPETRLDVIKETKHESAPNGKIPGIKNESLELKSPTSNWKEKARSNKLAPPSPTGVQPATEGMDGKAALSPRRESSKMSLSGTSSRMSAEGAAMHVVLPPDDKPKTSSSVIGNNNNFIQTAIPSLPMALAVVCLLMNILLPGTGTILSGLSIFLCGKSRLAAKDDQLAVTLCVNVWVGVAQLFTVSFFLVGWFWSMDWGFRMISIAMEEKLKKKQQRERELQTKALSAFGSPSQMRSFFSGT